MRDGVTMGILLVMAFCHASAEMPYDAVFAQAMSAFDNDYRGSWSFTEERVVNGVTTIATKY